MAMENDANQLPPCGIYRTRKAIGEIPEGRLVYFHNHGDPGPGVYLPASWNGNRAKFHTRGTTLTDPQHVHSLEPLEVEGFYRVVDAFHCCEKNCRLFEQDMLVQLGYNGHAIPILFVPQIVNGMLAVPESGTRIDQDRITHLRRLKVPIAPASNEVEDETTLH